MKHYDELTKKEQEVVDCIDVNLYGCKEVCKSGNASDGILKSVITVVLNTLDNWKPRLTPLERREVLEYVQSEYGVCM